MYIYYMDNMKGRKTLFFSYNECRVQSELPLVSRIGLCLGDSEGRGVRLFH